MNNTELYGTVDHTLLNPTATQDQIRQLCREALACHTASVCIPPSYVAFARKEYGSDLTICTVIGFPLGYNTTASKAFEAADAIAAGADEIDMVIQQGWVKDSRFEDITNEISAIKAACADKILKVIVETCNLSTCELVSLCKCVTAGGADFIKTSTGFGASGAHFEVVKIMKDNIGDGVKIKAAGGIRTKKDMETYIELGCSRLGTSSAVNILGIE